MILADVRQAVTGVADILFGRVRPEAQSRRPAELIGADRLVRKRRTVDARARQQAEVVFQHIGKRLGIFEAINADTENAAAVVDALRAVER
jgi:hypothetical protein